MKTTSQLFRRLALLLGSTTLLFTAWAQNQATLTPIGKWPDYPLLDSSVAVRVSGSYAYVAGIRHLPPPPGSSENATLRLLALDVSTPSQPRYVSHVDTSVDFAWPITTMEISGPYVYVTQGTYGSPFASILAVFSLDQPSAPRLVGTCPFTGSATDIEVVGNHAYVPAGRWDAARWFGVLIFDVTDPAHPTLEATVYTEGFYRVSVAGNYAYIGGAYRPEGNLVGRVDIIDVSQLSQAALVAGFDIRFDPHSVHVWAIATQGSLLHVGSSAGPNNHYEVYDLSDPLNPSLLARYELPPEDLRTIRVVGNLAYLVTSTGLRIIDLTDPRNPQVRAFVSHADPWLVDPVDIADQRAYWSDGYELMVLDVKDPTTPFQVGQIDTGFGEPWISIDGNLAYLLDGQRFRVLNISNPRAPTLVGAKDLNSAGPFTVVGEYAYVAAGNYLQVFDLSNPSQPVEAGRFNAPCNGLDVVGNRAYVTGSSPANRLSVIDVSNPSALVRLGYLSFTNAPGPPLVVGDFAYCRLDTSDLVILDIRDPSAMVEIGRYHPTNGVHSFQVVGHYAYVLLWDEKTLHVVDLTDPAKPKWVGQYLWAGETLWPEGLLVQGRCAFVALYGDTNRVDILDVGDPTHPVKSGEHYTDRDIAGFAMSGNTLYTTSDAGLTVLDFFAPNVSPRLRLNLPVLASGVALLTWEGGPGITLQKCTSLTNPNWQDVPGTTGQSLAILPQADAAFFRLLKP